MAGLEAVALVEKDTNNETMLTWSFPSITEDTEEVAIRRTHLKEGGLALQFSFSKYRDQWIYSYTQPLEQSTVLPRVTLFAIIVFSKTFDPERFAALTKLLASIYASKGTPVSVLQAYLAVFSRGEADAGELGKFVDSAFDVRRAYLVTNIKDVIRMFGTEIILVWSALMMKKRVVVYAEKLSVLLRLIRALPLFVFHRQNWSILRPYVSLEDKEVEDLKQAGVYVAGFTDATVRSREDLWDLFVDVNERVITVAEHSKADFGLGSIHREVATYMMEASEDAETTDQALIKNLVVKIKEMLGKLQSLQVVDKATNSSYITWESLQERKLPAQLQRFLFAVASAEGMAKDTQKGKTD